MVQINTYEQFADIKNAAVRLNKLKLTNFLVPSEELKLHILNGSVFFEKTEKCLCVIIKIRQYNYLYFWCAEEKDAFIPDGVDNVILTAYTNTEQNNDWAETAQRFDLQLRSKMLQVSGKPWEFTFPQHPLSLRNSFKINIKDDYTYDYYVELSKPYFDYENDNFPEEYIWNGLYKDKLKLAEIRTNDGDFAAFYTFVGHHKSVEIFFTVVVPKYRGLGIQKWMFEEAISGYDYCKTWVQDWNSISWRNMETVGLKKTGNYRILYGRKK